MKTYEKRRREPGFSLLANLLEKDVRTLHRWITKRPELRSILRVQRQGKQWRIDYPENQLEFENWIEEVRRAISTFTRTPERKSEFVREGLEFLGFAGEEEERKQRERDIEILRHALLLKHASRKLPAQEADDDGQSEDNPPSSAERETEVVDLCTNVRMVSVQFKCRVEDVLGYWREFCKIYREEHRKYNAPKENWLKECGLYERAQQLLPEAQRPGALLAFIGAARADGKPRVKLYRFDRLWRSNRNGCWRTVHFRKEVIQLLRVGTDEEIAAEVSRVKELWPDPMHWQRARKQHERDWQLKTLGEAALELVRDELPVNGKVLAPILFRNPTVQDAWKLHQRHLNLKQQGTEVMCDEDDAKGRCNFGKRGISLREFRQRYTKKEVTETRNKAEAVHIASLRSVLNKEVIYGQPAKDDEDAPEKDEAGVGVRDEHGEALTNATEKEKDFASPETTLRVRRQLEQSQAEFDALTQEERRKIEAALGRPLEDYIKKPFKEDFKPA